MRSGAFIVVEGMDGAGKTTQVQRLLEFAARVNGPGNVEHLRLPGGTPMGEAVRKFIKDPTIDVCPEAQLLTIGGTMMQAIVDVIAPALRAGKIVIADRWIYSSVAYQGFAQKALTHGQLIPPNDFTRYIEMMENAMKPDFVAWLDIPVEVSRQRLSRAAEDAYDQQSEEYFEQVRRGYEYCCDTRPRYVHRIDAHQSVDDVQVELMTEMFEQIPWLRTLAESAE